VTVERLLVPDNRLQGPRVVTVRVRPFRVAYIIPDDDIDIATRVVESCCLTWGGASYFIVPYSRSDGFTLDWLKILQTYDPDDIVDCVGFREDDEKRFEGWRQPVHKWKEPLKTPTIIGALQYSALYSHRSERGRPEGDFAVQPILERTHPLFYPVVASFGRLHEEGIDETLRDHGVPVTARYADFFEVREIDFSTDEALVMGRVAPRFPSQGGVYYPRSLVELTWLRLPRRGPSYTIGGGGGTPERPEHEESYVDTVLVTGNDKSVSDMCFFWSLSAQRPHAHPFPLWIPLSQLKTEAGKQAVATALAVMGHGAMAGLGLRRGLHIVSTSVSEQDLRTVLDGHISADFYVTKELHRFFSSGFRVGFTEDREASFTDGGARVAVPFPEMVRKLAPLDRLDIEVSMQDFQLPQSPDLHRHAYGRVGRISRGGMEGFSTVGSWPQLVPVGIPSAWQCLESMLKDAGYKCEPSDKGNLGLGIIQLVGGISGVAALASSAIYDLLGEMSQAVGRQFFNQRIRAILGSSELKMAEADVDGLLSTIQEILPTEEQPRHYVQFSRARDRLGSDHADQVMRWLLERRLVFRGAELVCPVCQLRKWYPIEALGSQVECAGCQRSVAAPLQLDVTHWQYRINELYAKAYDQGVLPHLLTIYASYDPYPPPSRPSSLGFHPGLKIKALDDSAAPATGIREMEFDFTEIVDGRLIIGECKTEGSQLDPGTVERFVTIGNHLNCSRLVFSTLTDFEAIRRDLDDARDKFKGVIDLFERSHLLDVLLRERTSVSREDLPDAERAQKYLSETVSWLPKS